MHPHISASLASSPSRSPPIPSLLRLERALLPGRWARDVLLEVDDEGVIDRVVPFPGDEDPGWTGRAAVEKVGGVVLPGVPNLHSHAFQRAMAGLTERGSAREETFWSWRARMYAFLERLTPEDIETVAAWLYVEMLEAGYTAVGEFHYLHHDRDGRPYADPAETSLRTVAAARTAGIGMTHLPVLYMAGDFGGEPAGKGQRRFLWDVDGVLGLRERIAGELAEDPDRSTGLALHSLRAVPPEALGDAVSGLRAADATAPVHVHVAEQRREVEACLDWSGLRPVAWLLDHAPVDGRWCLVHATHLTADETARLAASGAVAGLCPTTEANLGDGLFPLAAHLAAGGRVGVGSDSHVSVSPVEELRWLEYGQRLLREERNVAALGESVSTGRRLLEEAVAGGGRALGREVTGLAVGGRADLVVLDPEHPVLVGRSDDELVDAWIFSGNVPVVRHVMVGGRWVVRDGSHPRREAVARAYREAVARLGGPPER